MSPLRRLLRRARPPADEPAPLTCRCERCGAEAFVPVKWEERGRSFWWIRARCGRCGLVREAVATDEEALAFDRDVMRGMVEIRGALERIERRRMREDAELLAQALERDLIDAADFR